MMENKFLPPQRTGKFLQGILILILAVIGGYFFYIAIQEPSGLDFLLYMMIALVIFSPLPLLIYRLQALSYAVYLLRRDGLSIRWGIRREDIPLGEIEWMRPASELGFRLPMPWLRWPGAILGSRKSAELGTVEFLASDTKKLILVATPEKVFAVSPDQTSPFMALFRQLSELGSLSPLEPESIYPTVLLGKVWEDRRARWLVIASFVLGLILVLAVVIAISGLETIRWIEPGSFAPAERLLLLPILAGMIWLGNLILGLFLYRQGADLKTAAYFLWGSASLTSILLLIGSLLLIF